MRLASALAVSALLHPCLIYAVQSGSLSSCTGANVARGPSLEFRKIVAPARIAAIRKLPSKSLEGFAPRYGIRRVTLFSRIKASERPITEPATARVYLQILRLGGTSAFYALSPEIETGDEGASVVPATPDGTIPLVSMETGANHVWSNTYASVTTLHFIDLRNRTPKSIASLDCTEIEGRSGFCNAFDGAFGLETDLQCAWVPARTDYLCTRTETVVHLWGHTAWKETFYLFSGEMKRPADVDPEGPQSLSEWLADGSTRQGSSVVLPEQGDTFALWKSEQYTLLASRGDGPHLWPELTLVESSREARPVKIRTLPAETGREETGGFPSYTPVERLSPGVRTGPVMTFTAKRLDSGLPAVDFFQVLLTQEDRHSLFWVAVDRSDGKPSMAQALLIATDAAEYDGCLNAHVLASAARTQWTGKDPVLATLDAEPLRFLEVLGEDYYARTSFPSETDAKIACPYDVDLRWSREDGWLMAAKPRPCDQKTPKIRTISISDVGEITAAPAKTPDDE